MSEDLPKKPEPPKTPPAKPVVKPAPVAKSPVPAAAQAIKAAALGEKPKDPVIPKPATAAPTAAAKATPAEKPRESSIPGAKAPAARLATSPGGELARAKAAVDSMDAKALAAEVQAFRSDFERMRGEVAKMIVGYEDQIEKVVIALIAGGNVLLEGVPGLGKTMLIRALSETLQLTFRRVQFTPDLMPADIIGTNIVDENEGGGRSLRFQPGPLFTNLLLADEINRATPRTQSALLEAMEEHTVTVGGHTYVLEEPFFVMATQNPVEQSGTYPLPTAQLDKFLFKLIVGFPNGKELDQIIERTTTDKPVVLERVTTREKILQMRELARRIPVASHVQRYASLLVLATDPESSNATETSRRFIRSGASPRGVLSLLAGARIRAVLSGRYQVSTEDVRDMALPALRHRIARSFDAENEDMSADAIIADLLKNVSEEAEAVFAAAGSERA